MQHIQQDDTHNTETKNGTILEKILTGIAFIIFLALMKVQTHKTQTQNSQVPKLSKLS